MKEYNDYVGMTKRYLKSYTQLHITVKNLDEGIEAQKTMLQDEAVAISRYGDEPGGGSSELNATESAANRRIMIENCITEMERDKAEIECILRKVNRALEGLSDAGSGIYGVRGMCAAEATEVCVCGVEGNGCMIIKNFGDDSKLMGCSRSDGVGRHCKLRHDQDW